MAVLLAKSACVMETVCDLHGDLTNLALVIRHPVEGPRLYRRLRRVWMAEAEFDVSGDIIRNQSIEAGAGADGERAYHYFVTAWMGMNGVAGTRSYNSHFCMRYTANGGHAAKRWRSAVASIPAWRRRMRNVTILPRDAFEVVDRIDDAPGTAIYADPPYLVKGSKYLHDFSPADHGRLAAALGRFRRARVVVSYYAHPDLERLYPPARWSHQHIAVTKALCSAGMRGGEKSASKADEVLIVNDGGDGVVGGLFA
jgi:DNA adenine methylase